MYLVYHSNILLEYTPISTHIIQINFGSKPAHIESA